MADAISRDLFVLPYASNLVRIFSRLAAINLDCFLIFCYAKRAKEKTWKIEKLQSAAIFLK